MLATAAATAEYAARHPDLLRAGHFRDLDGLRVSSLGLGTYIGDDTPQDDERCRDAALSCLQSGINLLDTAINYRAQRSERALGEALQQLPRLGLDRAGVVVCTKAGYLPFDGTVPRDGERVLRRLYVDSGIVPAEALVDGCHCLHPAYLRDQAGRSLRNLRLQAIDVFYLHNPEQQLTSVARPEFERRVRDAFALCEELCQAAVIGRYGCATWDGLRVPPESPAHLSLARLLQLAREAGGDRHHFRVVQLPLNFAMTEALSLPTQELDGRRVPLLQAADALGIAVMCSTPLLRGRVIARPLPERLRAPLPGLRRDSQRALQFVRSAPGVTAALCGMKSASHVAEALEMLAVPPLGAEAFMAAFRE